MDSPILDLNHPRSSVPRLTCGTRRMGITLSILGHPEMSSRCIVCMVFPQHVVGLSLGLIELPSCLRSLPDAHPFLEDYALKEGEGNFA